MLCLSQKSEFTSFSCSESSAVFCGRPCGLRVLCHIRSHNFASQTIRVEMFGGKARSIERLFDAVLLFLIGFLLVELQSSHIISSWLLRGRGCFVT
jgi:hypothetical protein